MSSVEHLATVDKGLKMKIKRKNVNVDKAEKQKKDQNKTETSKLDTKSQGETSHNANGMLVDKASKLSLLSDKEKSPKSKAVLSRKDKGKGPGKGDSVVSGGNSNVNGLDSLFGHQSTMEPKLGETPTGKDCRHDPYEFNAKVEDGFSMPMKKMKLEKEKVDVTPSSAVMTAHMSAGSTPQDASTDTHDVAVSTEPDCLGPCEPGTQVNLEGIVWHESDNGVLVVNVTWRGKTYVGTLLDATRHDWAPPRLNCDSPTSEFESRTPKGRGKRRGASNTPVNDTRTLRKGRRGSQQTFTAPPSPAKSDVSTGGVKRKGRPQDIDLSATEQRSSKRSRSGSQVPTPNAETPPTDAQGYIECPEPNCNKKYRHANGLKYHQSHAHSNPNLNASTEDAKDMDTEDLPLSVVKNNVKKEKEVKKESNKKDNGKESNVNSDKNNKSDNSGARRSDKDDKESESESVKESNKSDAKCDNLSVSKKKDNSAGSSAKVPVTQAPQTSNSKSGVSQNSSSKPNTSQSSPSSSQTNSATNSVIATSQAPSSASASPLSNSCSSSSNSVSPAMSPALSSVSHSEAFKSDSNKLVDIKPKITSDVRVTKPNRPIVPAPPPQVLGSVQVTHSNLSPVMSHAQMSPQLKPIQPKPTIMGETQNINPALADLNKERKKVPKKKLKDGQNGNNRPEQPAMKVERTGVIKTNPLPNSKQSEHGKKDGAGAKDIARQGSESQRSQNLGPNPHKGMDVSHSRLNQNSSLIKVGSPLQVATPDNHKAQINEDVQSPAYSDISDANESASPAAPSDNSPQKSKEDPGSSKKEEPLVKTETSPPQQQENNQMMPHYPGMYHYYGQSPYGINNMSPGQKSNSSTGSGGPSGQSSNTNQNKEPKGPVGDEKKPTEDQKKGEKKPEEKDPGNRPKGIPPPGPGPIPSNLSPQQMHEYKMQQQNWYQQMYIQSLPPHLQYQYMANGWFPSMDPTYMQQVMDDHRRNQGEPGREREGGPPGSEGQRHNDRVPGSDMKGQQQGPCGPSFRKDDNSGQKPLTSPGQSGLSERSESNKSSSDDKSIKDQALRDKQSENHQILKENIDLKNEMDKNRQEYERMRQEEMRRYKMYQEQKMSSRKGDGRGPENLSTKPPGTKPLVEHSPRGMMPGQQRPVEEGHRDINIKRESIDRKDSRDMHSRDKSANGKYSDSSMKSSDEKSRTPISDKQRSDGPLRNPETPKHRPGGSSSKSGSPSTSLNSSVPGSPSYSPYLNSYPYMQNPKFLGIDPNHPMYRNHSVNPALMPGYPGSAYIHPSQMGYRPSPDDDKDKSSAQKPGPTATPTSDSDLKKGGSDGSGNRGGSYYGSVHKIHELSEKGRPRSRNSSPGPIKSTEPATSGSSYDKHRDYTNSPPTQRHVHTHHHTHVLQPGPGMQAAPGLAGPPGFSPVYDPYSGYNTVAHGH